MCWNDRLPAYAPVSDKSIVFPYLSCEFKAQLISDLYVAGFLVKRGEDQSQALPLQSVLASYGQEEHSGHGHPFGTWPGFGLLNTYWLIGKI